jgi:pimeloyl-ACP methyl ester carboxylesterase
VTAEDDTALLDIRRGWLDTRLARMHYAESGSGAPVLFLHQTPRSWLEYVHVLPRAGRWCHAIAVDSLGFGDSDRPAAAELTIELLAAGVVGFLDAYGLDRVSLVGHHTGGIVALDVAASYPERVDRLVLSSVPLIDEAWRRRVGSAPRIDVADPAIDGSHLLTLWRGRQPFYPSDRVDLLDAFIVDALRAKWPPSEGHHAVQTYRMEDQIARLVAPTVLVASTDDPFVFDDIPLLAAAIDVPVINVDGGMIPLPDQFPDRFERIVRDFVTAPVTPPGQG